MMERIRIHRTTLSDPGRAPRTPSCDARAPRREALAGGGGSDTSASTAGSRLRALQQELAQPIARRGDGQPGRATAVHGPAPLDLGLMDYLDRHVAEAATVTRQLAPDAGQAPRTAEVYAWMEEQTAHLDAERALVRDAMVYRHNLALAIAAGDDAVVRREPCPGCGCWGTTWNAATRRAMCPVRSCTDKRGRPSTWSLAQLAEEAVRTRALSRAT